MLRRNKFIAHAARFFFCDIHYTLEAGCDEDLRRAGVVRMKIRLGRNLQGIVEPASDVVCVDLQQVQNLCNHPIRLLQQAEQHVLDVKLAVLVARHNILSARNRVLRPLSELVKTHHKTNPF